jgi:hypothetical protein
MHDPIRANKMRMGWILRSDFANGRSKFRMHLQRPYTPGSRRELLLARLKQAGHRAVFAWRAFKSAALLASRLSFGLLARSRTTFPHRHNYLFERVAPVVTELGMWAQGVWRPVIIAPQNGVSLLGRHDPGICPDVKAWCQERGQRCPVLAESQVMHRDLPETLEPEVDSAFVDDATFESRERFVARIPSATILGHNGWVRLSDGRFAPDYINGDGNALLRAEPDYWSRWQPHRRKVFWPGSYYSVMGMYCREYHHWLHDVLMQLWKVLDFLPPETRLLVPAGLSAWQVESLKLLGVSPDRLAYFDPAEEVTVEELVHIPPATVNRFDHPEAVHWLRDKLWAALSLSRPRGTRIYITRRRSPHRYVANEPELLESLEPLGFEAVECERLSFADQVRLFYDADIIAGPHGAGLTNLAFARSGAKVLEILFHPAFDRTHYWSISESLGLRYAYVAGRASGQDRMVQCIHVDPHAVRQTIDLLSTTKSPTRQPQSALGR